MNLKSWKTLARFNEKELKSLVAPHNKELFNLQLSAYSTALCAITLLILFEYMEPKEELEKVMEKYEDDYTKIIERIEGLK